MTERPRRGFPFARSAAAQVNYSCVQIGHAILRRHRITGAVQRGNSVTHSVADATRNWCFDSGSRALCPAPDPVAAIHQAGRGACMMSPGSKRRPRPGGGADDISCLCSFLDVPPDKAIRGARDGSPLGLVSEAKSEAEIFLLDRDSNGQALTAPMSRSCCMEFLAAREGHRNCLRKLCNIRDIKRTGIALAEIEFSLVISMWWGR